MTMLPIRHIGCLAAALLFCFGSVQSMAAEPDPPPPADAQAVTLIKTPPEILTRQKLPNFVGVSGQTAGAKGLSMNLVVIPPGAAAEPHFHEGVESAVYVLEGRVGTRYGPGLAGGIRELIVEARRGRTECAQTVPVARM